MENKIERLYLMQVGKSTSIHLRINHAFITSCDNKDLKRVLKTLLEKSTKDFYRYLDSIEVTLPHKTTADSKDDHKDREEWYLGAWKGVTEKVLKELKLTNIIENVPYDLIHHMRIEKQTGWGLAKEEIAVTKENDESLKKFELNSDDDISSNDIHDLASILKAKHKIKVKSKKKKTKRIKRVKKD